MNTLLLRLVAPMQSWGIESHFSMRDSGLEPSKSGVIGLICAALGRPRQSALDDLTSLRMGVRVDREGLLRSDFHIAQNVLGSDGINIKSSVTSNRYYLSDAAFLVGLEYPNLALLEEIYQALQKPVWAIFLGRKAFAPSTPVWLPDGLRLSEALETALINYPWVYSWTSGKAPSELRLVIEDLAGEQSRSDVPISFAERRFSSRRVKTKIQSAPTVYMKEVRDESIQAAP
jgi:CRISPR system Cascade subunit CasD